MSFAALNWACEQELPAMQKIVLVCLAYRMNHKTGRCDPSMETLAKDCGMASRSVMRSLDALVSAGKLERTLRSVGGMKTSNAYRLMFTDVTASHIDTPQSHDVVTESHSGCDTQSLSDVTESHINKESLTRKKEPLHRAKRSRGLQDERHTPFKEEFERVYLSKHGIPAPWNGQEAKMLANMLAATPRMTLEHWEQILRHRFASEDATGEPLSSWVKNAQRWYKQPLDRFGKPLGGSNGINRNDAPVRRGYQTSAEKSVQAAQNFLRSIGETADGSGSGEGGNADGGHDSGLCERPGRVLEGRP